MTVCVHASLKSCSGMQLLMAHPDKDVDVCVYDAVSGGLVVYVGV